MSFALRQKPRLHLPLFLECVNGKRNQRETSRPHPFRQFSFHHARTADITMPRTDFLSGFLSSRSPQEQNFRSECPLSLPKLLPYERNRERRRVVDVFNLIFCGAIATIARPRSAWQTISHILCRRVTYPFSFRCPRDLGFLQGGGEAQVDSGPCIQPISRRARSSRQLYICLPSPASLQ